MDIKLSSHRDVLDRLMVQPECVSYRIFITFAEEGIYCVELLDSNEDTISEKDRFFLNFYEVSLLGYNSQRKTSLQCFEVPKNIQKMIKGRNNVEMG